MHSAEPEQDMATFRREVLDFVAANLPPDIREKVRCNAELQKDDHVRWQTILAARGWYCAHWPEAAGGAGWSPLRRYVFEQALAEAGAPWMLPFGPAYVGPVIAEYGNDEQKRRFLPDIIASNTAWCQGYSEPNAGSDLAGLKTRARRDGAGYRVTGQKLWTSFAHWADMMFCLARTSDEDRPQNGISFLLLDMRQPGVTIRPIVTMDMRHHVNEVFLDEVFVPEENLVGREGHGWEIAKFLLSTERLIVAETGKARRLLTQVRGIAEQAREGGQPLFDRPVFRRGFVESEIALQTLEAYCSRLLKRAAQGEQPGYEASLLKIRGSELLQTITALGASVAARTGLALDLEPDAGQDSLPDADAETSGLLREYLSQRAASIYGGSNEIQHNIVAKARFGFQ
jgi:alkylation response protein AidB-like acyl-CoA dehydrogenase